MELGDRRSFERFQDDADAAFARIAARRPVGKADQAHQIGDAASVISSDTRMRPQRSQVMNMSFFRSSNTFCGGARVGQPPPAVRFPAPTARPSFALLLA